MKKVLGCLGYVLLLLFVTAAAVFGARGNAGVVLAQLFRGLGKGLSGKYNATSSEFGKAFLCQAFFFPGFPNNR